MKTKLFQGFAMEKARIHTFYKKPKNADVMEAAVCSLYAEASMLTKKVF